MDGTAAASNVACPATLKKVTIRYCVVARAYGLCVVAIFWGAMNVDRFEQHTFGKGRWSASLSGVARQGWPRLLLTSLALAACSQGTMAQTVAFQQTTACAYSYTVPAGVTSVQVAIGGAGAGGGSGDFNGGNGGNGGAGAGVVATIAVTGGQTITGVVGAPGTGGVSAGPGAGGGAGGAGDGAGNRGGNTGGSRWQLERRRRRRWRCHGASSRQLLYARRWRWLRRRRFRRACGDGWYGGRQCSGLHRKLRHRRCWRGRRRCRRRWRRRRRWLHGRRRLGRHVGSGQQHRRGRRRRWRFVHLGRGRQHHCRRQRSARWRRWRRCGCHQRGRHRSHRWLRLPGLREDLFRRRFRGAGPDARSVGAGRAQPADDGLRAAAKENRLPPTLTCGWTGGPWPRSVRRAARCCFRRAVMHSCS